MSEHPPNLAIALAVIAMIGGWGTAVISNWEEIFPPPPDKETVKIAAESPAVPPTENVAPSKTVAESKSCAPGSCIKTNGECGSVALQAWCANPDTSSHSCGTTFKNAVLGINYFTDPKKLTASSGKRAGTKWLCL